MRSKYDLSQCNTFKTQLTSLSPLQVARTTINEGYENLCYNELQSKWSSVLEFLLFIIIFKVIVYFNYSQYSSHGLIYIYRGVGRRKILGRARARNKTRLFIFSLQVLCQKVDPQKLARQSLTSKKGFLNKT